MRNVQDLFGTTLRRVLLKDFYFWMRVMTVGCLNTRTENQWNHNMLRGLKQHQISLKPRSDNMIRVERGETHSVNNKKKKIGMANDSKQCQ